MEYCRNSYTNNSQKGVDSELHPPSIRTLFCPLQGAAEGILSTGFHHCQCVPELYTSLGRRTSRLYSGQLSATMHCSVLVVVTT
jgi:hypothetical protein